MIVAAFTAAGVALIGVGVLIGLWLTRTPAAERFSDERGGLGALRNVWETSVWEQGYAAAVEAFGYAYDPGVQ